MIKVFHYYFQVCIMKAEEEPYCLSGWQSKEENESTYGEIYIKRLQQKLQKINTKLAPPSKVRVREDCRIQTKESDCSKFTDINCLKRDRQYLEKHLWKEDELKPQSHRSYQQPHSPPMLSKNQPQVSPPKRQRKHHKSTQIQEIRLSQQRQQPPTNYLEKYTLFSGVKQQKPKTRKHLLKTCSKEEFFKPQRGIELISANFLVVPDKMNLAKLNKKKEESSSKKEIYKKGLKFPLFYRESTSNQPFLRKSKHKLTLTLDQKRGWKQLFEFTDNKIFSTKFIRC